MTEFIKKVLVLDQIATGFGVGDKKVSGVARCKKTETKPTPAYTLQIFAKAGQT